MHYLFLTPDSVGSTILQRLTTMTLYLENHAVQNNHELATGLALRNGVAVKNFHFHYDQIQWDSKRYSQRLGKTASILHQSNPQTTLVSRLAKYHLDKRKDPANDCQDFYKLLNRHFEKIIMCVRENIFEYAMSWSIREQSGVRNVFGRRGGRGEPLHTAMNRSNLGYRPTFNIESWSSKYHMGVSTKDKVSQVSEVDEKYFIQKCQQYVKYTEWVEHNFPNVETVSYENTVKDSDAVMQQLTGHRGTFTDKIGLPLRSILSNEYNFLRNRSESNMSNDEMKALVKYRQVCNEMLDKKIIFGVPLKNTTLTEKKNQIKNFNSCLDKFYKFAKNHNWIDQSKATYDFWNEERIC